MLTPTSPREWIILTAISLLGIAVLAWLLPLSAHLPFVVPPALYDRMNPVKKPFAGLMNLTPVVAGVTVVTACALLYAAWMNRSLSRPIMVQAAARHDEEPE